MTIHAAVVLSFDLPNPESITNVISALNPPAAPHFTGSARIALGPEAKYVEAWLDEDTTSSSSTLIAITEEHATQVLVAHQRRSSERCSCGWARPGEPLVNHQLDMLAAD